MLSFLLMAFCISDISVATKMLEDPDEGKRLRALVQISEVVIANPEEDVNPAVVARHLFEKNKEIRYTASLILSKSKRSAEEYPKLKDTIRQRMLSESEDDVFYNLLYFCVACGSQSSNTLIELSQKTNESRQLSVTAALIRIKDGNSDVQSALRKLLDSKQLLVRFVSSMNLIDIPGDRRRASSVLLSCIKESTDPLIVLRGAEKLRGIESASKEIAPILAKVLSRKDRQDGAIAQALLLLWKIGELDENVQKAVVSVREAYPRNELLGALSAGVIYRNRADEISKNTLTKLRSIVDQLLMDLNPSGREFAAYVIGETGEMLDIQRLTSIRRLEMEEEVQRSLDKAIGRLKKRFGD